MFRFAVYLTLEGAMKIRSALLIAVLSAASLCNAASNSTRPGRLEGYVRDDAGKPVKGVRVTINQGSYSTQGHTDVVPLYIPNKFAGVFVFNDPNQVDSHYINAHATRTDKKGHYCIQHIKPGSYTLGVAPEKRSFNEYMAVVQVKKLADAYQFPGSTSITVPPGEIAKRDVVLQTKH